VLIVGGMVATLIMEVGGLGAQECLQVMDRWHGQSAGVAAKSHLCYIKHTGFMNCHPAMMLSSPPGARNPCHLLTASPSPPAVTCRARSVTGCGAA
jgi:hypothetical protein